MAMVVWVMMGIAIWHFAVLVPDFEASTATNSSFRLLCRDTNLRV